MNIDKRIKTFYERLDQLEERLLESKEDDWERSRARWRRTKPTVGLTWGIEATGDEFISKVSSYGAFEPEKTILEIGPGYGRLLKSCVEQKLPFQKYVAVDLSIDNIQYLQQNFRMASVDTIHADVEKVLSGHFKTGQRGWPGTVLFYLFGTGLGKPVLVLQLRGPHLRMWP